MRDILRKVGEIISDFKQALVIIVTLFGMWAGLEHRYRKPDMQEHVDKYVDVIPEIRLQCNKLKHKYKSTWVGVFQIHNGTVYTSGLHAMKLSRIVQSDYVNKYSTESESIAVDIPMVNLIDEYNLMKKQGYIHCSINDDLSVFMRYLMDEYNLKNIVCIPLYSNGNNYPDGFITYEYTKCVNIPHSVIENMICDRYKIEPLLKISDNSIFDALKKIL